MADKDVAESDDALGQATAIHQFASDDEEWQRHHGDAIDTAHQLGRDNLRVGRCAAHVQRRGGRTEEQGKGDRQPEHHRTAQIHHKQNDQIHSFLPY